MEFNYQKYIRAIKQLDYKSDYRVWVAGMLLIVLLAIGGYWLAGKLMDYYATGVYSVAIMARSQFNRDPIEDVRSSLKYGDILTVQPEAHNWSDLEKISYLIIKMNLTKSQLADLTTPKYRKEKYENLTSASRAALNARIKESGLSEVPQEIVQARQYRVNMEKVFSDFDPLVLLRHQPFADIIYDWSIIVKK
jgi:hypothetical protein